MEVEHTTEVAIDTDKITKEEKESISNVSIPMERSMDWIISVLKSRERISSLRSSRNISTLESALRQTTLFSSIMERS